MQDYQKQQIQMRWVTEDFQFRAGKVTPREHGQIQLALLLEVISSYDQLQPHYDNLKELAEKKWQEATKRAAFVLPVERKKDVLINFPEPLKKSFLTEDMQYRKGSITMLNHNKFLSDFLSHLVANAGTLEPFFSDLEKESQKQWDQYQNNS